MVRFGRLLNSPPFPKNNAERTLPLGFCSLTVVEIDRLSRLLAIFPLGMPYQSKVSSVDNVRFQLGIEQELGDNNNGNAAAEQPQHLLPLGHPLRART